MSRVRPHGKQLRTLLRDIEAAGGQVVLGRRGHWKVYLGDALVATISASASNCRAHYRVLADLRRAGLDVKVPR